MGGTAFGAAAPIACSGNTGGGTQLRAGKLRHRRELLSAGGFRCGGELFPGREFLSGEGILSNFRGVQCPRGGERVLGREFPPFRVLPGGRGRGFSAGIQQPGGFRGGHLCRLPPAGDRRPCGVHARGSRRHVLSQPGHDPGGDGRYALQPAGGKAACHREQL